MSVLLALVLLSLVGCSSINPVNWFRDTTGASKNDPGADTPNAKNLEAGGERPYPNLGSVPPPPNRALSLEERESLTQRLVADRANAKYIDDQLRIGPTAAAAPPPPAPAKSAATPAAVTAPAAEAAAPARGAPAAPAPAAPPPAKPPAASRGAATPAPAPEAPHESSLTSPEITNLPQPETPRTPPPPPADFTGGGTSRSAAAAAPPPAAAPPAAAPPASQQLASPAPASTALPEPVPGAPVAQIAFADNSARLGPAEQRKLDDIVPLQKQSGSLVRVVGYAAKPRGAGASQQLASFRMALERANAVATALAQAGIAPSQIAVEAAPPSETGIAAQRAEIFLEN